MFLVEKRNGDETLHLSRVVAGGAHVATYFYVDDEIEMVVLVTKRRKRRVRSGQHASVSRGVEGTHGTSLNPRRRSFKRLLGAPLSLFACVCDWRRHSEASVQVVR